ncbi:hypothetical protein HKX48_000658 [Thoreauomyces humboldtii]|nr:hypothetical protein HKX48_000658 [Thoreauomyces humboldtii]
MTRPWQEQDRESARQQWLQDLAAQTREQQERKQLETAQRKGSVSVCHGMVEVPWGGAARKSSFSVEIGGPGGGRRSADQIHRMQRDDPTPARMQGLSSRSLRPAPSPTVPAESGDFFWGSRSMGGGGAPLRDRHGQVSTARIRPSSASDEDNSLTQAPPIAISAEPNNTSSSSLSAGLCRPTPPTRVARTDSNYTVPAASGSKHARGKTVFGPENPDEDRRRAAALEWQATLQQQIAEKKTRERNEKLRADEEELRRMERFETEFRREGGGDPPPVGGRRNSNQRPPESKELSAPVTHTGRLGTHHPSDESAPANAMLHQSSRGNVHHPSDESGQTNPTFHNQQRSFKHHPSDETGQTALQKQRSYTQHDQGAPSRLKPQTQRQFSSSTPDLGGGTVTHRSSEASLQAPGSASKIPMLRRASSVAQQQHQSRQTAQSARLSNPPAKRATPSGKPPNRLPTLNHPPRPPPNRPLSQMTTHKVRPGREPANVIRGSQFRRIKDLTASGGNVSTAHETYAAPPKPSVQRAVDPRAKNSQSQQRTNNRPPSPEVQTYHQPFRSDSPPLPAQRHAQQQRQPQPPAQAPAPPAPGPVVEQHAHPQRRKTIVRPPPPPAPTELSWDEAAQQHAPPWRSSSPPIRGPGQQKWQAPEEYAPDEAPPPHVSLPERRAPRAPVRPLKAQHPSHTDVTAPIPARPPPGSDRQEQDDPRTQRQQSTSVSVALDQLRNFSSLLLDEKRRMVMDMMPPKVAS